MSQAWLVYLVCSLATNVVSDMLTAIAWMLCPTTDSRLQLSQKLCDSGPRSAGFKQALIAAPPQND
jgi:hypothetical protein